MRRSVVLAGLLASGAASADELFAQRGQLALVVSGNHEASIGKSALDPYPAEHLAAGVLWFFADGFAVGVSLEAGRWTRSCQAGVAPPNSSFSIFGVAPELAWSARFGEHVSLLARVSLPIRRMEYPIDVDVGSPPSGYYNSTSVAGSLELLVHFGHLFIALGPRLSTEIHTGLGDHATSAGVQLTLGGWL
jgi:hypothetical protein